MRPDIDAGVGPAAVPILEPNERALAAVLVAEVDHRCRAAERRRLGSRGESVDGARGAKLSIEMRVRHSAREHQEPRGIMHGNIGADGRVHADVWTRPSFIRSVRRVVVHRRDDPTVPDERRCHLIHSCPRERHPQTSLRR